jgi:hypothetical protein
MRDLIRNLLNEIKFSQEKADEHKNKFGWRYVQTNKPRYDAKYKNVRVYTFHTPKKYKETAGFKYIVNIEEYDYDYFIISFHPKLNKDFYVRQARLANANQKYLDQYSFLTRENIPLQILSLMISEMKNIIKEKPFASFGYFGAADVKTGDPNEDMFNTRRVRVYNQLISDEFKETHKVISDPTFSGSVILNREVMSEFPNFEKYCLDILETHL